MFRRMHVLPTLTLLAVLLAGCGAEDTSPDEVPETSDPPARAESAETAATAEDRALVNPETADASALAQVPHVTPAIAERLVAERPFEDMREVDALLDEDLDEAQREEVYRHLFAPLDLNEATEEEILLIPGVGSRMAHEFEEYRPYVGIEQFRREIGKYVDEAEVARLERYVRIP